MKFCYNTNRSHKVIYFKVLKLSQILHNYTYKTGFLWPDHIRINIHTMDHNVIIRSVYSSIAVSYKIPIEICGMYNSYNS